MVFGEGILGLATLVLWIFGIFDVIASEETLVRNLPKTVWLLLVIFVPPIGAIAWLIMGRPQNVKFRPGATDYRGSRRPVGPEDDAGFQAGIEKRRLQEWEQELLRREEELKKNDPPPSPS